MKYKHLETALAADHRIDQAGLKTFRARLRHLRNLGVPDVPKPGSGAQIDYSDKHAHQIAIALELEALDWDPAHAAAFVQSRWPALEQWCEVALSTDRMFLAIRPDFIGEAREAFANLYTRDELCNILVKRADRDLRRLVAVNLGHSLSRIHTELEKAAGIPSPASKPSLSRQASHAETRVQ